MSETVSLGSVGDSILITGGAGFIGSHLAERLLNGNKKVVALDNLSTGSKINIQNCASNPNFRFIKGSILDDKLLNNEVEKADFVFHLGSVVGVKLVMEQPSKTIESILQGSVVVLNACRKHGKPILATSTSEVYGKSVDVPFKEDGDRILGPTDLQRWAYADSKAIMEFLALAHYKEADLPVTLIRLFNTVGPRQSGEYGMVLPRFVQAALNQYPLTVYGDGKQTRTFCHVNDVVDAIISLVGNPKSFGEIFNIGSTVEVSIQQLAEKVIALANSKSQIQKIAYDSVYDSGFEDMLRRVPDISKIKKIAGWEPKRNLENIIQDVIQHLKENSG